MKHLKALLSAKIWIPIAYVSYSAYLVHVLVLMALLFGAMSPLVMPELDKDWEFDENPMVDGKQ